MRSSTSPTSWKSRVTLPTKIKLKITHVTLSKKKMMLPKVVARVSELSPAAAVAEAAAVGASVHL